MKRVVSIMMVMMLAFVTLFGVSAQPVLAKAKVKSVKVSKAKKKMTMTVGQKKTFKVKVKAAKKKYAKFTVKSSKKKVVKVTKKGKKITLRALKAGKAKITVRSKTNKKKKYVMTVTVKAKTTPKIIPGDLDVLTMEAKNIDASVFLINFSHEIDIKAEDLTIEGKAKKSDAYKKITAPYIISTSDKKEYAVVISYDEEDEDIYYRFSINSGAVFAECRLSMDEEFTYRNFCSAKVGDAINHSMYIMCGVGNYSVESVGKLPGNISYKLESGGEMHYEGTVTEPGTYIVPIKIKDGDGVVYNFEQIFVIGSEDTISTYSRDLTVYGYDKDGKFEIDGFVDVLAVGGPTGNHTFSLLDGTYDGFFVNGDGRIQFRTNRVGTYTAKIRVTDQSLFKDVTVKVTVKEMNKVSGYVKTKSGAPVQGASVYAYPFSFESTEEYRYGRTDENGYYEAFVKPGKCNVYCYYEDVEKIDPNKDASKDITVNFVLENVYSVKMVSPDESIKFERWSFLKSEEDDDYDDITGYDGTQLALPAGNYILGTEGYYIKEGKLYKYTARATITVAGDMEVTPAVKYEEIATTPALEGENNVIVSQGNYVFLKLVAEYSTRYHIESDFEDGDPICVVYDDKLDMVAYNDDVSSGDYNFSLDAELEEGKTYFVAIGDIDEESITGTVNITCPDLN